MYPFTLFQKQSSKVPSLHPLALAYSGIDDSVGVLGGCGRMPKDEFPDIGSKLRLTVYK
jgi:hypothetical protein